MRRKTITLILTFTMLVVLAACTQGNSQQDATANSKESTDSELNIESVESAEELETEEPGSEDDEMESMEEALPEEGKVLIAYFSKHGSSIGSDDVDAVSSASLSPGDTVVIAGMIKDLIDDADTFQIITVELYPKGYNETLDAVGGPWDTADELPELSTHVENIGDYETIVLISPIWFGTVSEPVVAFLQEYDFAGKTIVPVSSHWGGGSGKSFSDIALLCPDAIVLDGLSLMGNSASSEGDTIKSWLQETGLID